MAPASEGGVETVLSRRVMRWFRKPVGEGVVERRRVEARDDAIGGFYFLFFLGCPDVWVVG